MKTGFVYILSNKHHTVFYTGMSSDLLERVNKHRKEEGCTFTKKYNISKLLFYDEFPTMYEAIEAEKRIKKWKRSWKIALIKTINPEMKDLWYEISRLGQ